MPQPRFALLVAASAFMLAVAISAAGREDEEARSAAPSAPVAAPLEAAAALPAA